MRLLIKIIFAIIALQIYSCELKNEKDLLNYRLDSVKEPMGEFKLESGMDNKGRYFIISKIRSVKYDTTLPLSEIEIFQVDTKKMMLQVEAIEMKLKEKIYYNSKDETDCFRYCSISGYPCLDALKDKVKTSNKCAVGEKLIKGKEYVFVPKPFSSFVPILFYPERLAFIE